MKPFERLTAWQAAHHLYVEIYKASESWPPRERYGLTAQIRRAALSVGSNLAEGVVRRTPADFARFIEIGMGSMSELSYQLMAARDVAVIPANEYERLEKDRESASILTWRLYRSVRRRQAQTDARWKSRGRTRVVTADQANAADTADTADQADMTDATLLP